MVFAEPHNTLPLPLSFRASEMGWSKFWRSVPGKKQKLRSLVKIIDGGECLVQVGSSPLRALSGSLTVCG